MKVKELIKLLEEHEPEADVGFIHPSHDYWKTQLVTTVAEAREGKAVVSIYHGTWSLAEEGEEGKDMVLLSG